MSAADYGLLRYTKTDEAHARYKLSKTDAVGGTDSRVL